MLCFECDRDRLDELLDDDGDVEDEQPRRLDLSDELAALGREAARDAWVEAAATLERCPSYPPGLALAHEAFMQGLLESDRRFAGAEWRIIVHAYRNELHVLAAGGAR
ncbi:MAG TPA: hypothetical protein VG963_23835 [Polyangiaceae bacterium]|nr:hypothetical protein [Polyangiaceae bacterium]